MHLLRHERIVFDLVFPRLLPYPPILDESYLSRHQPFVAVAHTLVEVSHSRIHVIVGSANVPGSLFVTVLHVPLTLVWMIHTNTIHLLLQYLVAADTIHEAMLMSHDCPVDVVVVVLVVVVIDQKKIVVTVLPQNLTSLLVLVV